MFKVRTEHASVCGTPANPLIPLALPTNGPQTHRFAPTTVPAAGRKGVTDLDCERHQHAPRITEVFQDPTDMKHGAQVLEAPAHLLSRTFVSQSASDSCCIKYSVTSSDKQTSSVCVCGGTTCLVSVTLGQASIFMSSLYMSEAGKGNWNG